MFITVYSYHARRGQEQKILSLYREWQHMLENSSLITTDLLTNIQDPAEMMMLARFPDEDAAWAIADTDQHRALYTRLVGMTETGPWVGYFQMLDNR